MDIKDKKNEILKKIATLTDEGQSLALNLIDRKMRCNIDTLIDAYKPMGLLTPERSFDKKDNDFSDKLNFMFRHFRANPSDVTRTTEIIHTYVGTGSISTSLTKYQSANTNGLSDEFWNRITTSIQKYKTRKPNDERDHLFTWLIGYKGCGKTTFLNYLMSKKEDELNINYKSISIRINTAYIFDNNLEIEDVIKFKICKILFNYYCKDSEKAKKDRAFFDIDEIESSTTLDRARIENFYYSFTGENTTKNATKTTLESYAKELNQFLKYIKNNHNYSFLVILDNIDQMGIKPEDKSNYRKRLKQIEKLMSEDDQIWGVYLLVMRPATVHDIVKIPRLKPQTFVIQIPTFYDIYQSRKNFLLSHNYSPFKNKEELEKYLDTYVQVVGSSLRSSIEYVSLLSLEDALKNIEQFSTFNKRMSINLMRLYGEYCLKDVSLIDYLSTVISKENQEQDLSELLQFGYYRFFETLMLNDGYCCRFNGYDYDKEQKKLIFSNRSESSSENRFLTNLFKFPSKVNINTHYSIFVKIRILQFLKNYAKGITTYVGIENLKNELNNFFGYDKNVIDLSCQVLIDGNCVESSNDFSDRFDEFSEDNVGIRITDRGKIILATFPEKINYLSICYEDMPIPIDFILKKEKVVRFPMSNYYNIETDIYYFLLDNILYSAPIIIGFLKAIEGYEGEKYFNLIKKNSTKSHKNRVPDGRFTKSDFELVNRLSKNAQITYEKIIDTYVLSNNAKEYRYNYYMKLPLRPKE